MPQRSLSVVVPVYNGAASIEELAIRLDGVAVANGYDLELILVNDGSRDGSWSVIERLCERYEWVNGIEMMRNYGQHNALLCGIRAARKPIIVTMDDDLQHPPEEIPRLLGALVPAVDVVYGTPQREQHGLLRDAASLVTKYALQASMGAETARMVSAFRVFRSTVRTAFAEYQGSFISIDVLLTWGTTRFAAVEARHEPRRAGESNYTVWKLVTHALNMVTGFSTVPLQAASIVGFFFTFVGFGVLAYVVGRFLVEGRSVPGFAFLASIISLFAGTQLFSLGIIGEYLARMHFRMLQKPTYAVRSMVGRTANAPRTSDAHLE